MNVTNNDEKENGHVKKWKRRKKKNGDEGKTAT